MASRSRSRSLPPRDMGSRSPSPPPRRRSPSGSMSASPPPRRNGRGRSYSRSRSRSPSRSRSYSRGRGRYSRDASDGPAPRSTKIVVERLTKNINEQHLYEIFGQFGRVKDLDLPINRTFGTNRGTAYILYDHVADAEAAIAHMHEAQVDGATINVSIVLPRRKISPAPPTARRGANIDPRVPFTGNARGGGPPGAFGMGSGGRRRQSPSSRYGPRSDVYRPNSRSPSKSPAGGGGGGGGGPPSRGGGGSRYRSRSIGSRSSRSPSRSPRKRGGFEDQGRSRSFDNYSGRSRSRSPPSRYR